MNYFRTRQTDNIVAHLLPTGSFQYGNLGGLTIRGIQWESKYYFNSRMLAEGSLLYQTNEDAIGNSLHMPTPNLGGKAGLSYAERRGWTVGVFDVYTGLIPGYASTPNPKPRYFSKFNRTCVVSK